MFIRLARVYDSPLLRFVAYLRLPICAAREIYELALPIFGSS